MSKVQRQYYKATIHSYSVLHTTTPTTVHDSILLQFYSVLQRSTAQCASGAPLCTSLSYKILLPHYKVLPQYHSVLQRTTPVQLCTSKHDSKTTLNLKVLLQYPFFTKYYSGTTPTQKRTTPALLCISKYHSNTLEHYLFVLQSSMPLLQYSTQNYKTLPSTTLYSPKKN